uniref:Uncharacterized protein n=1 Tax=Cacopsylla melanoneura TaxID=428564 RepID=A0A8D8LMF2_9HEMI
MDCLRACRICLMSRIFRFMIIKYFVFNVACVVLNCWKLPIDFQGALYLPRVTRDRVDCNISNVYSSDLRLNARDKRANYLMKIIKKSWKKIDYYPINIDRA